MLRTSSVAEPKSASASRTGNRFPACAERGLDNGNQREETRQEARGSSANPGRARRQGSAGATGASPRLLREDRSRPAEEPVWLQQRQPDPDAREDRDQLWRRRSDQEPEG